MNNIEYLYTEGKIGDKGATVSVRSDGKIVGIIKPVVNGFQYFPKGSKHGGDIFKTIALVQKQLTQQD